MSKHMALTSLLLLFLSSAIILHAEAITKRAGDEGTGFPFPLKSVVKKEEWKTLVDNEFGRISAVYVGDGVKGPYHFHFFTLDPNSLLLPQLLHADMVFYVHTGGGKLSWGDEEKMRTASLKKGDIFRLQTGSVFFVQSDLKAERESLRIYALFSNTNDALFESGIGAYSSVRNLVRGFDHTTLKQAFKVPDELIESITSAKVKEDIVHAIPPKPDDKEKGKDKKKSRLLEPEDRFLRAYPVGNEENGYDNKKKKPKGKGLNLFEENRDFENCNGWSLTVAGKRAEQVLGETNIGVFMVNLTRGAMMGPHWNPRATEMAIVLEGRGMVQVVCPWSDRGPNETSYPLRPECRNRRFSVKEGDVFAVPRLHPMAQMSYNDGSLIFMGFTTTRRESRPQFLAGKRSVLQVLDTDVLAAAFNVPSATVEQIRGPQAESVILECISCAEEEEREMVEEFEKEKEEEAAREREKQEEEIRKREEEARKREEEEEKKEKEEEDARKREEEEAARQREKEEEEEEEEEEEDRRKREEEAAREREEEEKREEEEEEARKRAEEEAKRREEEERQRQKEEEIEREKQKQKVEEEERERQRQEEEERERARKQEEEEARKQQEEREEEGGGGGGRVERAFLKMWAI